jgi:hypothetical protein
LNAGRASDILEPLRAWRSPPALRHNWPGEIYFSPGHLFDFETSRKPTCDTPGRKADTVLKWSRNGHC